MFSLELNDSTCDDCNKVNSIYEINNNWTIEKLLIKLNNSKNLKSIDYYLDYCKCKKIKLLDDNDVIDKYNVPTKKALSEIIYKIYYRDNNTIYKKYIDTFMPSDKEYFELVLRILLIDFNPLKFNFINRYNVINLNLESKINNQYYEIVIHNYMVKNNLTNKIDFIDKIDKIDNNDLLYLKAEFKDLRWCLNQSNFLEESKYYKRILRLKKSKIFDEQYMTIKKKLKTATFLRNTILKSMYNTKTELGLKMFNFRIKLDGIEEYFVN